MSGNFSYVGAFLTLALAVIVKVSFLNMSNNGIIIELPGVVGSEFNTTAVTGQDPHPMRYVFNPSIVLEDKDDQRPTELDNDYK